MQENNELYNFHYGTDGEEHAPIALIAVIIIFIIGMVAK